jgi:glucose/mannose-6-phosphate isomerase
VLDIYLKWVDFYKEALKEPLPSIRIEKLVYLGIGGSGIPGEILKMLNLPVEYHIYRGYKAKADEKSTIIAVSYSGNTTETLVALKNVEKYTNKIIVITSGGRLQELAKNRGYPVLNLPKGYQTRYVFPFIITYLIRLINEGVGTNYSVNELIEGVKDTSSINEKASVLASRIAGNIPVFYASDYLPIAERFKQEINENAKYPAFFAELPEANHNEIELYSTSVLKFPFFPIIIASDKIDYLTAGLLKAEVIRPLYDSVLRNISSLTLYAGLLSVKLALLVNAKPEELRLIPKIREMTFKAMENELPN